MWSMIVFISLNVLDVLDVLYRLTGGISLVLMLSFEADEKKHVKKLNKRRAKDWEKSSKFKI